MKKTEQNSDRTSFLVASCTGQQSSLRCGSRGTKVSQHFRHRHCYVPIQARYCTHRSDSSLDYSMRLRGNIIPHKFRLAENPRCRENPSDARVSCSLSQLLLPPYAPCSTVDGTSYMPCVRHTPGMAAAKAGPRRNAWHPSLQSLNGPPR